MNKNIGRYKVISTIGSGAMANVYKAHDPQINRTLAIKVLKPEHASNEEYRFRFVREAKAAGVLVHPNIVTVYDVGEEDQHPYMVMELLEGKMLEDYMEDEFEFQLEDIINIGIQLAEALDYSHQKGVVHRDIKPSNIIYVKECSQVRITDFGIAHLDETQNTKLTQVGMVLGTPQYMSPEQIKGEAVDGRSDLFSVGVILYQLLANERPFTANTLATLFMEIINKTPPPLETVRPHLPSKLYGVIEKLLHKQPDKRFQTGGDLAEALKKAHKQLSSSEDTMSSRYAIKLLLAWLTSQTKYYSYLVARGLTNKIDFLMTKLGKESTNWSQQIKKTAKTLDHKVEQKKKLCEEHRQHLKIPLKLKWLAVMTIGVSITLTLASSIVYHAQLNSMRHFILDSGSSLAKLLATESALPVLSEDWINIKTIVDSLQNNQEFMYLYILDHRGILRGSFDIDQLGQPFEFKNLPPQSQPYANTIIRDWQSHESGAVFDFEAAITFQNKKVGTVHLGLSQAPLSSAANVTMWMMLLLFVVTTLSVIIVTYLLIKRITTSIEQIDEAIVNVIEGNYETVDESARVDEFGVLASNLNKLIVKIDTLSPAPDKEPKTVAPSSTPDSDKTIVKVAHTEQLIQDTDETVIMTSNHGAEPKSTSVEK
ncbi:serine/threonine protein kinase [Thalassotalea euphylliae]|uniref:non-specific serine/threonine protein kinase n=1 Tax=Thalassotalea euphylliae TaxID=1655234 RepID=A0A3E0TQ07_9GAMM|nr:serine/threonine-protein kinase [Thalassotalea euphylliae]REL26711.1 serine/threonine protein kinase [Thalassotalea euphylliae]